MRDLYQDVDHILLDAEQIQNRIVSLAQEIESDYQDANDLILLCVLKGAVLFTADLSRALKRPHSLEFMAISSYAGGTKSTGAVKLLLDLNVDIADKHILIVEDIVDSGRTLSYIRNLLQVRNPASLKVVTLLNKEMRRVMHAPVDYVGFEIPDEFVIGYGLDLAEWYRNLPFVGVLKPEAIKDFI